MKCIIRVLTTLENLENLEITWDKKIDLENLEITWDFFHFPTSIFYFDAIPIIVPIISSELPILNAYLAMSEV